MSRRFLPRAIGINISAIAIDYVSGGFYGVETAQNAVVDYSLADLAAGTPPAQISRGSFTTPASAGLPNPNSIAVAF